MSVAMKLTNEYREEAKLAEARQESGYRDTLDALAKLKPGEEFEYYQLPSHEITISLWPTGAFAAVRDAHEQGVVTPVQRRTDDGRLLYLARRK